MEHHRLPVVASLLAIGSGVVWSIGAVLSRSATQADAFQYLLWRSVGVVVVIELLAARRRQPFPTFRSWTSGRPMMVANIGLFLASLCFVYAVKTTTAANAAFLSSLTPLVASVFARFMGERLSRSTLVALATGVVGLTITVFGDLEAGNMAGNVAALASSIGFSIYTLAVRSDLDRDWSPALSGYGLLMITVCSGITLLAGKPLVPPLTDTMYALVHGAVVIVVGTLMFNAGSRHVPAVPMTVFAQTEMVFVPVWALLILHETPKALTLVGGAVTFAAVVGKAVYDTRIAAPPPVPVPDVPLL
ncbi:MAG: DMT family transporter [Ilumatobacter sp.]|nr:DMT family transporter [Ilumatobacter sp.]MCB0983334.1 DMT family transporter [Ilumatobacter sp.]